MAKLRFATLSAMGISNSHIKGILDNPDTELAAIADVSDERIALAKEKYADVPGVDYYHDYKDIIARDDIDAVIVTAPDQWHCEMTVAALEAGKHVLCEKPLALTRDECVRMVNAAEASGKKCMVGQVCRYAPGFAKAHEMIREGKIGDLFFVESEYAHDYSKIPGYGGWRLDPKRHGFLGGGCHAVDLLRWIAGDPYEVTAYANRKMLTTWPTDDCTIAIWKFPDNVIGKVFVSTGCKRDYTMRSVFYGSEGTIICDNTSPDLKWYSTANASFTNAVSVPVDIANHNMTAEIADFCDSILNDKPVPTPIVEGAKTVIAALAAVESSKTGAPVAISYEF